MSEAPRFTVSQFIAVTNQVLETGLSDVVLFGEVSSFKINQGKWVFFDLKDAESSVGCFMTVYQLGSFPLEDGMKIAVQATPKLTSFGKFSLTIKRFHPLGEGSLKKAFELLKAKLQKEGLFDPAKKRPIARNFERLGVISSTQAAGYADFIKIINERWGELKIQVAHTQVQGLPAVDQIVRAIEYMNQHTDNQVIALIRGGGSKDDLAIFNDEKLIRAIAASRIPIITGIGHEVDESLADLAADLAASTPSNAAQFLTRDRQAEIRSLKIQVSRIHQQIMGKINIEEHKLQEQIENIRTKIFNLLQLELQKIQQKQKIIENLNPAIVLKRGYAIVHGQIAEHSLITLETAKYRAEAKIIKVKNKE
jgi:exodeoxyribonuclease VII, large subunit